MKRNKPVGIALVARNLVTSTSGIFAAALLWGIATSSAFALYVPPGLGPDDTYHLVFVTRDIDNAIATTIGPYNDFVQRQAEQNPSLTGTDAGITYKVIGSSIADNVSAFNNAVVEAPVYLLDGTLIATGYDDMWDGELAAPINVTEFGVVASGDPTLVGTGSKSNGGLGTFPLGNISVTGTITAGRLNESNSTWIAGPDVNKIFGYRYYGLSEKITVGTGDQPPVADANGPYGGDVGASISFDGSASFDTDGTIESWEWDFGDGNTGSGETTTHTYATADVYTVSLTVTDNDVLSNTTETFADIGPVDIGLSTGSVRGIDPRDRGFRRAG